MRKHYDFSKAVQGKFHRPAKNLRIPIYLDRDVERRLGGAKRSPGEIAQLVNSILRQQLETSDLIHS